MRTRSDLTTGPCSFMLRVPIAFFFLIAVVWAEERTAPTWGKWKGHAPGTWLVTRETTTKLDPRGEERVSHRKVILSGQNAEGAVHFLSGSCNADFTFTHKPGYFSRSKREKKAADTVKALEIKNATQPALSHHLLDEMQTVSSPQFGKRVSRSQTLKDRPHVELGYRRETTDSFKGEQYQYL